MIGDTYHYLTVLSYVGKNKHGKKMVQCACICGATTRSIASEVRRGHTKSCGCLKHEPTFITHGLSNTPEHHAWRRIKSRTTNPKNKNWREYGERGIRVCPEWLKSFERFYLDMGPRPSSGHSIERIDVNGHYEPSNCRWATRLEQGGNKRNNVRYDFDGRSMTLSEWGRELGMCRNALRNRIRKYGWSVERALTTPLGICVCCGRIR